MANSLACSHLLSIADLDKQAIALVLRRAAELEQRLQRTRVDALAGRILAPLFYEPDPWARASFESAMLRLGGQVLSMGDLLNRPLPQGTDNLSQAARVASVYADVIVHRHPDVYSAHEASKGASVPLINAGDGTHEDPVQALADLYTLQEERGEIDGLSIAIVGDLRHSRAAHSLARALVHWDVTLTLVSPPSLKMATVITVPLKRAFPVTETGDLASAVEGCDVVYVTRGVRPRSGLSSEEGIGLEAYQINRDLIERAGGEVTVMCSRPDSGLLLKDIEKLPGTAIHRQTMRGVWVRMAILLLLLGAPPR